MTARRGRGRHAGDWPHVVVLEPLDPGLAIARRMVKLGARVSFIVRPGHTFQAHARGVTAVVRPLGEDGEQWIDALRELTVAGEETVVLSASDQASDLLLRWKDSLPENLRMFERSGRQQLALMDKESADAIAKRAGVAVPFTAAIHDETDISAALSDAPWPCVVKPILSHRFRLRYGEERVFVVNNDAEATRRLEEPLEAGIGMLLCQYIPGGDDAVEEAIVVRLADGTYPVAFGCQKLRQNPRGFGSTTLGRSAHLPETMELAQRVLDEAGFVGVAGVEAKRHADTGERWLLDVNVRIPAQWGLGDACGVQATPRLVSAVRGRQLGPQPPLRAGVGFIVPDADVHVCRKILGEVPARERPRLAIKLLRPYLAGGEVGLLDPRDPLPGLAWIAVLVRRRLERIPWVARVGRGLADARGRAG